MAWSTPATAVAGAVATAAWMNQYVRDNFKAIGDPWTAYTPTLTGTGTTQGNATMTGGYILRGKTVDFWAKAVRGSTTVIGSVIALTIPVTARSVVDGWAGMRAAFVDTGSNDYMALVTTGTGAVALFAIGASGAAVATSATVPFTWATGDIIYVGGTYEAA